MAVQTRTLPSETIEFSEADTRFKKLDRGWVYREMYLRLAGAVNISSPGSANSAPLSPEAVIKRLRLRKNTTQDVVNIDFHALARFCRVFFATQGDVGYSTVDPSSGGVQSFEVFIVLPLWQPQIAKPIEWALDATSINDLRIEIDWGTIADVVGDATATWDTEPTLEISKYVHTGGAIPPHRGWKITNVVSEAISAANAEQSFELTPGEMFRGFLIRTQSGSTRAPSHDVLNSIMLSTGSETFWKLREKELRYISPIRKDRQAVDTGYYFWDMLGDGYGTEALDTRGWNDLNLVADVNAPTNAFIDVWPVQMLPDRSQGNNGG